MRPKTAQYLESLDTITKDVIDSFTGISLEKLHLKSNPKTWSIAENIEHLITINKTYFPIFEKLQRGSHQGAFIGRFPFFTNLFGDMIFKSVADGGKKKQKTFPLWEPKINSGDTTILERFKQHQEELKSWIIQMEPFVEKNQIIHSPANKLIVYSLEKAIEIIIAHEKRHLDQAKRALG